MSWAGGSGQSDEKARTCLVPINTSGDECGRCATGCVYDEADQCEVPACAGHVATAARGKVADYRPTRPGSASTMAEHKDEKRPADASTAGSYANTHADYCQNCGHAPAEHHLLGCSNQGAHPAGPSRTPTLFQCRCGGLVQASGCSRPEKPSPNPDAAA